MLLLSRLRLRRVRLHSIFETHHAAVYICFRSLSFDIRLFESKFFYLDFIIDQVIDVEDEFRALDVHEDKTGHRFLLIAPPACAHCTRRAAWIDKELAFQFISLESVGMAPDKDIDIHLSRCHEECVRIGVRHECVSVHEPNTQRSVMDDFRQWHVRSVVAVALHDMQVRCDAAQKVVCFAIRDVSRT